MSLNIKFARRDAMRLLVGGGAAALVLSTETSRALAQRLGHGAARRPTLMLDPGHGGMDPGAIGVRGTYEKYIALDTAREVARLLGRTGRYHVRMTRDDDKFIALRERVILAQNAGADLFMSIHADAIPNPRVYGASVYTLSNKASDAEAAALAARENHYDRVAGVDLSQHEPVVNEILFDLARRQTNNMSQRLAQAVVHELRHEVALFDNPHRSAAFVVLKSPDIPSTLVELGCLSNRNEERELREASHRHLLAVRIARSIDDYFAHAA
ncbi:MAG: N-acetylmuramoyl-L-alanine amidase family protein [Stellaceae bacterium]